jgi:hypothetical protein
LIVEIIDHIARWVLNYNEMSALRLFWMESLSTLGEHASNTVDLILNAFDGHIFNGPRIRVSRKRNVHKESNLNGRAICLQGSGKENIRNIENDVCVKCTCESIGNSRGF